jgi:hypothetical protein
MAAVAAHGWARRARRTARWPFLFFYLLIEAGNMTASVALRLTEAFDWRRLERPPWLTVYVHLS